MIHQCNVYLDNKCNNHDKAILFFYPLANSKQNIIKINIFGWVLIVYRDRHSRQ